MLIFTEGEKPENPEKTLVARERTTHQTNSTHICPEQESNPDHSGERRALTHYATHATHGSLFRQRVSQYETFNSFSTWALNWGTKLKGGFGFHLDLLLELS
jgi:hypothetical protein